MRFVKGLLPLILSHAVDVQANPHAEVVCDYMLRMSFASHVKF